jgi:prepilin-type N-terminal cleavage/methylation domain-containing protein
MKKAFTKIVIASDQRERGNPKKYMTGLPRRLRLLAMTRGFTLAEVLITLGIIGVVAALTIPGLVAKYQKQMLKTQFKKTYAGFSIAFQKTLFDLDGSNCYYKQEPNEWELQGCKDFFAELVKNYNIVRSCNTAEESCVPDYSAYVSAPGCANWNSNENTAYIANDGTILIPYIYGGSGWPLMLYDSNGAKGPNKPGYDVFVFNWYLDESSKNIRINNSIFACLANIDDNAFKTLDELMN